MPSLQRPSRRFIALTFGLVLAATAMFGVPNQARASWNGHSYVIHPPVDAVGGENKAALSYLIEKPFRALLDGRSTMGYVPNEYFFISPTPDISIQIRGGFLAGGNPRDFLDPRVLMSDGRNHPIWEVYQLPNARGNSGYGRRLDAMDATDRGRFPGIDTSGGYSNYCPGGNCWQSFDYGWWNGVDPYSRFFDAAYPQFNGYYVFLLKLVQGDDQQTGYISNYDGIRSDTKSQQGADYTFGTMIGTNEGGTHPNNFTFLPKTMTITRQAEEALRMGYYLRTRDPYMVTSAPVNIAFGLSADVPGYNYPVKTYEQSIGGGRPYNGIHLSPAGYNCRPYDKNIGNADWDWGYQSGSEGDIGATVSYAGWSHVADSSEISGNWKDDGDIYNILTDAPGNSIGLWRDSYAHGSLTIHRWGLHNFLYQGGAYMNWDELPHCPSGVNLTQYSPKSVYSAYEYNTNSPMLSFNVTSKTGRPNVQWLVDYKDDWNPNSAQFTRVGPVWDTAGNHQFTVPNQANGVHSWRLCGNDGQSSADLGNVGGTSDNAQAYMIWQCTGWTDYYINGGPSSTPLAPSSGSSINYFSCFNGSTMQFQVNDPEGNYVYPTVYLSWDKPNAQGQTSTATTNYPVQPSGHTYSAAEMMVGSKPLDQYIREDIPEGANVNWYVISHDTVGSSDVDNLSRWFSAVYGWGVANPDNYGTGLLSQNPVGYKIGPASPTWMFHKNTRPNLTDTTKTTKKLYDARAPLDSSRQPLQTIVDGQSMTVELTITNTGETPTNNYQILDYLGSARDFDDEKTLLTANPSSISVNGQGSQQIDPSNFSPTDDVKIVKPNKDHNYPGSDTVDTASPPSDPANESYRMDFTRTVKNMVGTLNPGTTITIRYAARADRNQGSATNANTPDQTKNNYGHGYNLGGPTNSRNTTDPKTGTQTGSTPELTDVHTYLGYQEDYCDTNDPTKENGVGVFPQYKHFIDWNLGAILAPYVRGGRGSIHTNGGAAGFDAHNGDSNATFTVTAGGDLSHFTGNQNGQQNQIGGYTAQNKNPGCRNDGGIDWRYEMTRNIEQLKANPLTEVNASTYDGQPITGGRAGYTNGIDFTNGSITNNVLEFKGDVTVTSPLQIKGTGTIIVNGNLTLTKDMIYADDTTDNSLGIVVLGNLTIQGDKVGKNRVTPVKQLVGSYYVSDVKWNSGFLTAVRNAGCPVADPTQTTGNISTGASDSQLNVDGLMVARQFDFQRYYANANAQKTSAAENVLYDGRVLAHTPPAFGEFLQGQWYESIPANSP